MLQLCFKIVLSGSYLSHPEGTSVKNTFAIVHTLCNYIHHCSAACLRTFDKTGVAMSLSDSAEKFAKLVAEAPSPVKKLEVIAGVLARTFKVDVSEIGIFTFDADREMLVFVWPVSGHAIGSIPLNAHKCLATKTALEKTGEFNNSFASTPHLAMFESFIPGKENRVPIQKILSVPIMKGDRLRGVIQISRKGPDRESAGPDFTRADLNHMSTVAAILADHL